MFTGIVEELGILREKKQTKNSYQLTIIAEKVPEKLSKGESIAVNGTCLTVVKYSADSFTADVMPETIKTTNLRFINTGTIVNLELPLTANKFLGGHLLTGHIDGRGTVHRINREENARIMLIKIGSQLEKYMVSKGSVALNGVSLTIIDLKPGLLTVSLIPETWRQTNLQYARTGTELNIETDLIGKYVLKIISGYQIINNDKIDLDFLQEKGFC